MKSRFIIVGILALATFSASCGSGSRSGAVQAKTPEMALQAIPVEKVPLADPFVMLHDGVYYAYGTGADNGIAVMESDDLLTWRKAKGRAAEGLALHKNDVWGDKWFWAPEVYFIDGIFYMYYSAEEHICAATSDSPLGPFVQKVKKPMIENEKCIDNTLFIDDDGHKYIYFDRFNDGLNIWVAEVGDDLITVRPGTMRKCINVSQEWETVWPRVNEGCFVVKYNNTYYMTYSANSYESQSYGVGCATAPSPLGPWTKYGNNPLLQSPGELVGVGHSAMFRDKAGKLHIVFHAHKDREHIHPREMYFSGVQFRYADGRYVMEISADYTTPRLE